MKTKMTFVSLALILACSASAQMTAILPGGRGNLYIGTPMTLPGPMSSFAINQRIRLPSPLLNPSVALAPAPVPMTTATPILLVTIPRAFQATRFASPAQDAAAAKDSVAAARETLDTVFDGRKQRKEKSSSDDLGPVRPDRHHSLPENDLEKEIGAY